jgi:hypothetical protein
MEMTVMTEPKRSRPVFSSEDFTLIRKAIMHYMNEGAEETETAKLANLYHRLGSLG